MALITCKECNNKVSTMAVACPNCGAPVSVQSNSNLITKERSKDRQNPNGESTEPAKILTSEESQMEEMVARAQKSGKSLADEIWPKSAQTSIAEPPKKNKMGCLGWVVIFVMLLLSFPITDSLVVTICHRELHLELIPACQDVGFFWIVVLTLLIFLLTYIFDRRCVFHEVDPGSALYVSMIVFYVVIRLLFFPFELKHAPLKPVIYFPDDVRKQLQFSK
jgi:hypothetical protein